MSSVQWFFGEVLFEFREQCRNAIDRSLFGIDGAAFPLQEANFPGNFGVGIVLKLIDEFGQRFFRLGVAAAGHAVQRFQPCDRRKDPRLIFGLCGEQAVGRFDQSRVESLAHLDRFRLFPHGQNKLS